MKSCSNARVWTWILVAGCLSVPRPGLCLQVAVTVTNRPVLAPPPPPPPPPPPTLPVRRPDIPKAPARQTTNSSPARVVTTPYSPYAPPAKGLSVPLAPVSPIQTPTYKLPAKVPGPSAAAVVCPLVFAADVVELTAGPGDTNVIFPFAFTNTSAQTVTLERVHTSCGCTTPRLPPMPWVLEPGTNGAFEVALDIRGKRGQLSKMVYLYTSHGFKALTVRATIPEAAFALAADRMRNLQQAKADRQAVFRGDCARCHAAPAQGRVGRELFEAVCGICHEAAHRAEMVPDLRALRHGTGEAHWREWITHGKAGTLMPAFAQAEGGPLSPEQVDSLVDYLSQRFPARPPTATPGGNSPAPQP